VIQRAHPDVVPLALPLRQKPSTMPRVSCLASHPPIFGSVARAIKMGSSDAYHDQRLAPDNRPIIAIIGRRPTP